MTKDKMVKDKLMYQSQSNKIINYIQVARVTEPTGDIQTQGTLLAKRLSPPKYMQWFTDMMEWVVAEELQIKHVRKDEKLMDDMAAWAQMLRELRNPPEELLGPGEEDGQIPIATPSQSQTPVTQ
ncbi:hypothetical protein NDU88_004364 [Pleurodeles waltl]|uniref:Uncharacterized protein n=1 Tax=Pleurodeles waltl TaxID=8319 RepID=A0AAV7UGM2_PLEWA|nr:hypothetical protein NDU88_004364 [Pleurodeles waltl]